MDLISRLIMVFSFFFFQWHQANAQELDLVTIPTIDFSRFRDGSIEERKLIGMEIGRACAEIGFFILVGHGIKKEVVDNVWNTTSQFFDLPDESKLKTSYPQHEYPYGYNAMGDEILSVGKDAENTNSNTSSVQNQSRPPDLKEMFSVGPKDPLAGMPPRKWPTQPVLFEDHWSTYYDALAALASDVLQAFAIALELPDSYFFPFIDRHASAMRALNYPSFADERFCHSSQIRRECSNQQTLLTPH